MGLDEIQEEVAFMNRAKIRDPDIPSPSCSDINSPTEDDKQIVIPSEVKVQIEDAVEAITPLPEEPTGSKVTGRIILA